MISDNQASRAGLLSFVIGAKGFSKVIERILLIGRRYGFTTRKMDNALNDFEGILSSFNCSATFPTPGIVVKRYPEIIQKYQSMGIEFAVHGLRHIDYSQLPYADQYHQLSKAQDIFSNAGIRFNGFRTPYLRRDNNLDKVIEEIDFSYSSNQPILWDAIDLETLGESARKSYLIGVDFYDPWRAAEKISMPFKKDSIVYIPVSLPDDEMLVDRIDDSSGIVTESWRRILDLTYKRGELFTLQLHPERIKQCEESLSAVLEEARLRLPKVWIATLEEVDDWWRKRLDTEIKVSDQGRDQFSVSVSAAKDVAILLKNSRAGPLGEHYWDDYKKIDHRDFSIQSPTFPGIGLAENYFANWNDFLLQQGYLVERINENQEYAVRIDQDFQNLFSELEMINHIESTKNPLLRIACWPTGYRSALSVTGDLDGLTLWDYFFRLIRR